MGTTTSTDASNKTSPTLTHPSPQHLLHDTPILGMSTRPPVSSAVEYGSASVADAAFWVEYPSGLVDVSRSARLSSSTGSSLAEPPELGEGQREVDVDGRTIRIDAKRSALVVIDMQK